MIKAGDKVTGTYYGVKFEGTISEIIAYTDNWEFNWYHFSIVGDFVIFGTRRENGCMLLNNTLIDAENGNSLSLPALPL